MDAALHILILGMVSILFLIALLGVILPVLPGPVMAFAAVLAYKLIYPDCAYGWNFVIASGALAALAQVIDLFFTYYGAKRYGASWGGITGAFAGLFIAIFIPPQIITIFVLPIVGAVAGELLTGKKMKAAVKAGWGTFVGTIFSMVLKITIVLSIIAYFYLCVLPNVFGA